MDKFTDLTDKDRCESYRKWKGMVKYYCRSLVVSSKVEAINVDGKPRGTNRMIFLYLINTLYFV